MHRDYASTPLGQIHYREAGSGPPLVLVHQTALSGDMFGELIPLLVDRFHVFAPDTPGYGQSPGPADPPGMGFYVRALAAFLDAVNVDCASFLGIHTGAALVVQLAAEQPERIDRLVFVGIPDYDPATRAQTLAAIDRGWPFPTADHLVAAWQQARDGHYAGWATLDQVQRGVLDRCVTGRGAQFAVQAVFEQEARAFIPRITAPSLLLYGDGDPFVDKQEALVPLFRNARSERLSGLGVLPVQQDPARFAARMVGFLSE